MLTIEDGVIYINKGDDANFTVAITDETGASYTMQTGDTLTLTVRALPSADSAVLLQSVSTTTTVILTHTQTNALDVGKYSADIQLAKQNGEIITVYPILDSHGKTRNYKNFIIDSEVTT